MNNQLKELIQHVNSIKENDDFKIINNVKEQIKYLLEDNYIRNEIDWILPKLVDLTSKLNLDINNHGKVYALSFPDTNKNVHLKTPIFGGLFLLQILLGRINNDTSYLAEAGGVNTGFGLKHLATKFDLNAKFYTSRYLPSIVLDHIMSDKIEIIKSEANDKLGIEEEFYIYFVKEFSKLRKEKNIAPLWHIKNSFLIGEILAEEIYKNIKNDINQIDKVVTGVGSGTSLSIFSTLKQVNNLVFQTIVSEHEKTPIFHSTHNKLNLEHNIITGKYTDEFTKFNSSGHERVPHSVYGPHYEKINNKIPQKYLDEIDFVSLYSDEEWKEISLHFDNQNISIGNSSAANLSIAKKLALHNENILTFIYETQRNYIKV